MANDSLVEGHARDRIAEVLLRHIARSFGGNEKRAAEDLGFYRQRLHSYISKTSFPGADVFDIIREKWGLDLLNVDAGSPGALSNGEVSKVDRQLSLDLPARLANAGLEIVLERKGAGIAVGITISPDVEVA